MEMNASLTHKEGSKYLCNNRDLNQGTLQLRSKFGNPSLNSLVQNQIW